LLFDPPPHRKKKTINIFPGRWRFRVGAPIVLILLPLAFLWFADNGTSFESRNGDVWRLQTAETWSFWNIARRLHLGAVLGLRGRFRHHRALYLCVLKGCACSCRRWCRTSRQAGTKAGRLFSVSTHGDDCAAGRQLARARASSTLTWKWQNSRGQTLRSLATNRPRETPKQFYQTTDLVTAP